MREEHEKISQASCPDAISRPDAAPTCIPLTAQAGRIFVSSTDSTTPAQALPNARVLHVLVVDDILINRVVVSKAVEHWGHAAEEAVGGRKAADRVAARGIDLVLMDVEMPGVDGFEATRLIRALPGVLGRTPVWAVTCRTTEHDLLLAGQAGMDGRLCKPLDFELLQSLGGRARA
jgi:CheY-like chemotaxis protein